MSTSEDLSKRDQQTSKVVATKSVKKTLLFAFKIFKIVVKAGMFIWRLIKLIETGEE